MIAGPTSTLDVMCKAICRTCNTLDAVASVDIDRSPEDRTFFAAESAKLKPLRDALLSQRRAIDNFNLGAGDLHQTSVELGDEVLDRGLREGNTRTKLGLKGKIGLGADHAFGNRIDELADAPHRQEPSLVRGAISRLDDVPDFDDKAKVKTDLTTRVELQEGLLDQRDNGHTQLAKLESDAIKLVVDGANALAQTKAALDGRFPRQRKYVARFFLDVTRRRQNDDAEDGGT